MNMHSVLFANSYAQLGGGELALLAHVHHLRKQDVNVYVLLLESGPLRKEIEDIGGCVIESSFSWQGNKISSFLLILQRIIEFRGLISKIKPDLLIAYTYNDFIFCGLSARLCGCPVIYRSQGEVYSDSATSGGGWLGHAFPKVVRFIKPRIICTTAYEAGNMIAAGIPVSLVTTIHLGVPPSQPNSIITQADYSKKGKVIIGIFGRLVKWKGQDVFVRAMGDLARKGYEFEAWIVGGASFGDGDAYVAELNDLIVSNGLLDQVKLLGFRRDVAALMQQCTVICHCSDFEPFGLVIVEAMMAGKVVIATDVSGPRESIVPGESGFLIPPREPAVLANLLASLLADPVYCERVGMAAKKRAEAHFDIEKNLRVIDSECEKLIV